MIDILIDRIIDKRNPTVVGLDTRIEYLPSELINKHKRRTLDFKSASDAIFDFNRQIIDKVYEYVPAVKVQVAYYEMYGISGLQAFYDTCKYAKEKGLLVIGDVKRNDIGSTAEAYANAYLGRTNLIEQEKGAFNLDFITINPYLGIDGVKPFIKACEEYNKGIFILVKTSNPSSSDFQDLYLEDKKTKVYEKVANKVSKWGDITIGNKGYSSVGAVVGATHPNEAKRLRVDMPHTYFLVPGYGAQGGGAEDVCKSFDNRGLGAIVNASRSIICAYRQDKWKQKYSSSQFAKAALAEVLDMKESINAVLEQSGKIYWR
ncbi:MAG: orotidine-5'-phosphate decarboxylase [Clostridiales bacterium]|nr:orotidine-5'-phosphate decarboxylase [Clostridiales bacterium]